MLASFPNFVLNWFIKQKKSNILTFFSGSLCKLFFIQCHWSQGMLKCELTNTKYVRPFFTHYDFCSGVLLSSVIFTGHSSFSSLWIQLICLHVLCKGTGIHSLGLVPPAMLFALARSSQEGSVTIYPGASFHIRRLHVKWQQLVQLISWTWCSGVGSFPNVCRQILFVLRCFCETRGTGRVQLTCVNSVISMLSYPQFAIWMLRRFM